MAEPRVGKHYRGDRGLEYFGWQRRSGHVGAALNARKFAAHVRASDRVLDFGCGGGFLLEQLEAADKLGVEPNPVAREAARQRGLEVFASPADVEDGSVDVVVSNHALEHTLAPLDELRALWRVLRPGGRLVLWLPLDDWRMERRPVAGDPNHHLYTWTPLLVGNLLDEAGFTQIEARVVTHAWPPHVELFAQLPEPAFDLLARCWSAVRRRRQVAALAVKPAE
ncbi:MAG TPA: methyltransferase domain-containing protein [Solirubrobacteraceae bacterium]|nr:methyltransferase domain-containing protein [Solirubrobacteraceae bacterium]